MKKTKKLISLLLAAVMLFSITAGIDLSVYAYTSKTQQEAVNWANSQIGKALDYDGVYGAQCVDLIYYYYKYLGVTVLGGNASAYKTNSLPSGWKRIKNGTSGFSTQPGDIAVWNTTSTDTLGHVAIVKSSDSSTAFTAIQQNYGRPPKQYVTKNAGIAKSNLYCVIRPDFKTSSTTNPSVSVKGASNITTNSARIDFTANNPSKVTIKTVGVQVRKKGATDWKTKQEAMNSSSTNSASVPMWWTIGTGKDSAGKNFEVQMTLYPNTVYEYRSYVVYNGKNYYSSTNTFTTKTVTATLSYNSNGGSGSMANQSVNFDGKFTLRQNSFAKSGYSFEGWNVLRKSDNKWMTGGNGWCTQSVINSNGYEKKVYSDGWSGNLNSSWFTGTIKNDTYTFYAVWEPVVHTHSYTYYSYTVQPNCVQGGYTEYHCSCGEWYRSNYTSATGHSYDSGRITKAATCTQAGVKTYTCTKCNATKTEELPAAGHTVVTDKATAPTCTAPGKTEGSHCAVCGLVITAQETLPATGHSYDGGKITIAATATTTGIKTYTCTKCGAEKTEIIPATGLKTPTAKYTVNSDRTFTISWDAVEGAEEYEVYFFDSSINDFRFSRMVTETCFKTGKAVFGTTYKYKVRALSNNTASEFSNVVNAVNSKYLASPAAKYAVNSDCTLTVSWGKVTGADKYEIYSYNASTGKYKYVKTTSNLSHKTGKATFGTTYKYKIRAVNSANNIKSGYCTLSAVNNKKLTVPSAKLKVNTNGTFTISWNKVKGATKYEVYIFDSSIGDYRLSRTSTGTTVTTSKASKGKTYYYKVRAVTSKNSSATSGFSAVVKGKR